MNSDRTYWLCLFNKTTWQEFLDAGGNVMGFPQTRQNTVKRVKSGDYLLGYMTGISKWMVALEVTSDPYFDAETKIWKQAAFPCRVQVKPIIQIEPDSGVPALSLSKQMRLFDNLKTPHWGLLFRQAPRELHSEDGELVVNAIREVEQT